MPQSMECLFQGLVLSADDAVGIRNRAKNAKKARPDFRCLQCDGAVIVHRGSPFRAPHFEHHPGNPACPLAHVGYIPVGQRNTINQRPIPDFEIDHPKAIEGYEVDRWLTTHARNRAIVDHRKRLDDFTCAACGHRLEIEGRFLIECHHTKPVAEHGEREVDLNELVSLCPNCHRIAHMRREPFTIDEIKIIRSTAASVKS